MSGTFSLRPAGPGDVPFLVSMLVEAVNFAPDRRDDASVLLKDPQIAGYVDGWPDNRDCGFVAIDEHGRSLGASWRRYRTASNPGYGFISPEVPELTIAVSGAARGRGLGRALLRAIMDEARASGVPMLSLSVERANHVAMRLYKSEGWRILQSDDIADTLVVDLAH